MIGGTVTGGGGTPLGRHLVNADLNRECRAGDSRGLMAEGVLDQVRELTDLARASGHKAPIRHAYASPPPRAAWTDADWKRYWATYEQALGLEGCPFSEAIHDKPGQDGRPPHRHRVYLALTERGTLVRTGWDYAAQEAVSRIAEADTGAPLTKGAHNIRAATIATRLGRPEVAAAMRAAGLLDGSRARAALTPPERAQAERTAVDPAAVAAAALAAWRASDGGDAFAAALAERGLRLARGEKVPVIVDASGAVHPLGRLLGKESKTDGDRIGAAAVRDRLAGLDLPLMDQVAALPQPAPGAAPPDDITPPTTPGGHHASPSPDDYAPTEAADLVRHPDRRDDGWRDAGREDPGSPTLPGFPGPGSDDVRSPDDGAAHGGPDAAPGPAGPAGGEGADAARPGDRAPGGHRGGAAPARGAAGRHRVQGRRALHGLAAAVAPRAARIAELTEALRRPPTATGLLAAALAASDERVAQVLAGQPWSDPRTRSARLIAGDLHEARMAVSHETDRRAEAARAEVDAAQGKVGLLDRLAAFLGVRTAAVRDVDEAEERAAQAEAARDGGRELREDLARLDGHARGVARAREAEHEAWSRRPEVVTARREVRGNDLVRAAVAANDFRIGHLAVADLPAAREAVLRREAERLTEIQRQQHDRRTVVTAPAMRLVPAPGGPRR